MAFYEMSEAINRWSWVPFIGFHDSIPWVSSLSTLCSCLAKCHLVLLSLGCLRVPVFLKTSRGRFSKCFLRSKCSDYIPYALVTLNFHGFWITTTHRMKIETSLFYNKLFSILDWLFEALFLSHGSSYEAFVSQNFPCLLAHYISVQQLYSG